MVENSSHFKKGMIPWNKGRAMSENTKEKLRKNMIGRKLPHTSEWNKKVGDAQRGIKRGPNLKLLSKEKGGQGKAWNIGLTKETDERVKESGKNISNSWNNKTEIERILHKRKLRESKIKYVEKQKLDGMPLYPTVGINEKEILDKLEKKHGTIQRQYRIVGYFLDGYSENTNTAFEVDEYHHFDNEGNLSEYDIKRQREIENELQCEFIRIKT